jgi:hypothetical protein
MKLERRERRRRHRAAFKETLRVKLGKNIPAMVALQISAWGWGIKVRRPSKIVVLTIIAPPGGPIKLEDDLGGFPTDNLLARLLLIAG